MLASIIFSALWFKFSLHSALSETSALKCQDFINNKEAFLNLTIDNTTFAGCRIPPQAATCTFKPLNSTAITLCSASVRQCVQPSLSCRCVGKRQNGYDYILSFTPLINIDKNGSFSCVIDCIWLGESRPAVVIDQSCKNIDIAEVCDDGFYSQGCQLRCGNCSGGEACDHKDGLCPEGCMSGYKPPLCQEGCDDGFYGNCTNSCGQCADGQSCDKVTGSCTSCLPGYKPPFCQECINGGCTNDAMDANATSTGESSSENEFPLDIVLISIGLVLLVGVIAIALLVRHRRLTAQNSQLAGMPSPHPEPIPETQNSQLAGTPSEPIPEEKHVPSVASSSDYSGSESPHDSSDISTSTSESMKSDIIEDQ